MIVPRARRPLVALFVMATTVAAAALPPAHIHVAGYDPDAGGIEHSHWSSHGGVSRFALDDDDGHAIFVDHPALVRDAHAAVVRPITDIITLLTDSGPLALAFSSRRLAGNAPRDGPSRDGSFLRGPPLVL